jgi:hypothetical protein
MIAHALEDEGQAIRYLEKALAINPHFSILYADLARTTLDALKTGEPIGDLEELP